MGAIKYYRTYLLQWDQSSTNTDVLVLTIYSPPIKLCSTWIYPLL